MSIERKIYVNNDLDIVMARMQAREMAKQLGFGTTDQARISLAASALARILAWTNNQQPGEIIISEASKNGYNGIQVACLVCFDQQYGDNSKDEPEELTEQKHSLDSARNLVDESLIEPQDNKYTRVTLMKWLAH